MENKDYHSIKSKSKDCCKETGAYGILPYRLVGCNPPLIPTPDSRLVNRTQDHIIKNNTTCTNHVNIPA